MTQIGRDALLDTLDALGAAALRQGVVLDVAVYGGSALMLASNVRFASEDVDAAEIARPWPAWLTNDPAKRPVEAVDILNLMAVLGITDVAGAVAVLGRYLPRSAALGRRPGATAAGALVRHAGRRPRRGSSWCSPRPPSSRRAPSPPRPGRCAARGRRPRRGDG